MNKVYSSKTKKVKKYMATLETAESILRSDLWKWKCNNARYTVVTYEKITKRLQRKKNELTS